MSDRNIGSGSSWRVQLAAGLAGVVAEELARENPRAAAMLSNGLQGVSDGLQHANRYNNMRQRDRDRILERGVDMPVGRGSANLSMRREQGTYSADYRQAGVRAQVTGGQGYLAADFTEEPTSSDDEYAPTRRTSATYDERNYNSTTLSRQTSRPVYREPQRVQTRTESYRVADDPYGGRQTQYAHQSRVTERGREVRERTFVGGTGSSGVRVAASERSNGASRAVMWDDRLGGYVEVEIRRRPR